MLGECIMVMNMAESLTGTEAVRKSSVEGKPEVEVTLR